MHCRRFYFSLLGETTTTIYGVLFLVLGVLAAVGNTIAAHILWKSDMKTMSNKVLKSLVISDALVGYISCPMFVYQLLTRSYLDNCILENIRNLIVLWLGSSSALNVVLIAFDRYILMTKLTNYNRFINNTKLNILIVLTWIIPFALHSTRYINYKFYSIAFIISGIVTVLMNLIAYIMVLRTTKQMKKRLQKHDKSTVSGYQLRLSRNVTIIVACFILCIVPSLVTVLISQIYEPSGKISSHLVQQAYLFSFFSSSLNSCVNPFIYASKFPRFKKHLFKLFNITQRERSDCGEVSGTSNSTSSNPLHSLQERRSK